MSLILLGFFAAVGGLRQLPRLTPLVLLFSALGAVAHAMVVRRRLNQRRSSAATLKVSSDRLVIDEPSFDYKPSGPVRVAPLHMEYSFSELSGFTVASSDESSPFEGALQVHLCNKLSNYHLCGRDAEQLRWVCRWLCGETGKR
jgi:hypothetical protein